MCEGHDKRRGISCTAASLKAVEAKCLRPACFFKGGALMSFLHFFFFFDSGNHSHASLTCGKALNEAVMLRCGTLVACLRAPSG